MTPLDDLREKIATARAIPAPFGMVVLTVDEAQAIVDAVTAPTTVVNLHVDEVRRLFENEHAVPGRVTLMYGQCADCGGPLTAGHKCITRAAPNDDEAI